MKKRRHALLFPAVLLILAGCSASSLDSEVSSSTSRSISGTVAVDPNDSAGEVYIWLEGTSVSTRSDAAGHFEVSLPRENSLGFEDGIYNLHFYLANYGLETASVVLRNGAFDHSKGDVNGIGELTSTKRLLKLLQVSTAVDPDLVSEDFSGIVSVSLSLRALFDSVEVALPKFVSQFTDALIFTEKTTGAVLTPIRNEDPTVLISDKIGPEAELFNYDFEMRPGLLPPGDYTVVPFFMVQQDDLPPGLLESISPEVGLVSPEFLKLPFKREGGRFVVHL